MKLSRKLPEAEFEIMKVVWEKEPPLTSTMLMEELKQTKDWKVPTLSSLLALRSAQLDQSDERVL